MKTSSKLFWPKFIFSALVFICFFPVVGFADTEQPVAQQIEQQVEVSTDEKAKGNDSECPEDDVAMMGGMGMGTAGTMGGMGMGTMGGMGMGTMGGMGTGGGMGMMNTEEENVVPEEAITRSPCAK